MPKFSHSNIVNLFSLKTSFRNLFWFFASLLFNVLSAPLEGISFGLILMALSILSTGSGVDFAHYPILSTAPLLPKLQALNSQQLFVLFFTLAILAQILRSGLSYLAQIIMTILGAALQTELQQRVYGQILRFSFPCVSRYKIGDLVEYVNAPSAIIPVIIDALNRILSSTLTVCSLVVMMFFISAPLTVLSLIIFGILALSQKFIIYRLSASSRQHSHNLVEFNKHSVQNLHALRVIHTFNRQNVVLQQLSLNLKKIAEVTKKLSVWNYSIPFITEITGIALVGGFLFLGEQALQSEREAALAILLTFITIVYRLNGRIQILLGGHSVPSR